MVGGGGQSACFSWQHGMRFGSGNHHGPFGCRAQVTTFGFDGGVGHYYRKPGERSTKRRAHFLRHHWAYEKHCFGRYRNGEVPGLKVL